MEKTITAPPTRWSPSTLFPLASPGKWEQGMARLIDSFGRRLRALRKSRRMTLEQLGHAARIGFKHVSEIERGVKTPSFDALERLARALRVHPYELFLPDNLAGSDE